MSQFATQMFLAASLTLFVLSLVICACKYPKQAAMLTAFCVLVAALCSKSHAATAEVAVLVDSATIDKSTVERELAAASDILAPTGVRLVLASYEVNDIAAHTNPVALLDVLKQVRTSADIRVFLTARKLSTGSQSYSGMATQGPACGAYASAVVSLRYDGSDSLTLAHEIAHTFGVAHDAVPGYLMAAGLGATSTLSPDTLGVMRGAYLDCMPDPVAAQAKSVPAGTPAAGGGGATDWVTLAVLAALCLVVGYYRGFSRFQRWYKSTSDYVLQQDAEVEALRARVAQDIVVIAEQRGVIQRLSDHIRYTQQIRDVTALQLREMGYRLEPDGRVSDIRNSPEDRG